MLRKFVLPGMRGRKKDSVILIAVIALSIVFSIASTAFFTSSEYSRYLERIAGCGSWPVAVAESEAGDIDRFAQKYPDPVIFRGVGLDESGGFVASAEGAIDRIGGLRLLEGTLPSRPGEIAYEFSRKAFFPADARVGELVPIALTLYDYSIGDRDSVEMRFARATVFRRYRELLESAEHPLRAFFAERVPVCETQEEFESLIHRLNQKSAEFGEETLREYFGEEIQSALRDALFSSGAHRTQIYSSTDSEIAGEYLIRRYRRWIYGSDVELKENATMSGGEIVERMHEVGLLFEDRIVFYANMRVSGILADYSGVWEHGGGSYPNAFIAPETAGEILGLFDKSSLNRYSPEEIAQYRVFGSVSAFASPESVGDIGAMRDGLEQFSSGLANPEKLVVNEKIYPAAAPKSDRFLMNAVVSLIFVATVICVFQINLAQFKRRTRKLVLLKSIGMTNGQMSRMLASEAAVLLSAAVPIGVLLGFAVSRGAVFVGGQLTGTALVYRAAPDLAAAGTVSSVIAAVLGFSLPAFRAVRTPMVGSMSVPKQPKHIRRRPLFMSFGRIWRQNLRLDRRKTATTGFVYTVAALMLTGSIWASHLILNDYFTDIVLADAPDFELMLHIAPSELSTESLVDRIREIGIFERVDALRINRSGAVSHPAMTLVPRYAERQRADRQSGALEMYDAEHQALKSQAMRVAVHALIENSDITRRVFERTMGGFSPEKFVAFDADPAAAILILPYHDGRDDYGYDFRRVGTRRMGYPIRADETIDLAAQSEQFKEGDSARVTIHRPMRIVGAAVGLGEDGIWPFSRDGEEPLLFISNTAMSELFPNTRSSKMPLPPPMLLSLIRDMGWASFGETRINLYLEDGVDPVLARSSLDRFLASSDHVFAQAARVGNTYTLKNSAYDSALNVIAIVSTLGVSVFMILMMIQYNVGVSRVENEREQLGVLRALGVTGGQYRAAQLLTGLCFGAAALLASNLVFAAVYAVIGLSMNGGFGWGLRISVLYFPWRLFFGAQLLFLLIGAGVYYLPIRSVLRHQPIENIRALQR